MSKPTQSIFPIENGRLTTDLDCNNLQLINLDESNLSGGGGGSGNDTGTTTALLKGDGNHGFSDAVAGTDYATPGAVDLKEDTATHDADILVLTTAVDLTEADIATLTTAVGTKASSAALTAGLALKADDADLQAYITSNDADVALKAYITDVDDALAFKADASGVTTSLSLKEDLLPTTSFDGYILSRNTDGSWHLVDPVTLGTTNQTFTDGQSFTNTNYDSATAAFVTGDIGKTITCAGVIPDGTTIVSRTSATRVVLSAPTLSTATGETFTIINRLLTNNTGTVTSVSFTNNVTNLLNATSGISNPTSSPTLTLNPATVAANSFYGNFTNFAGFATFGTAATARTSLGGTTAGQALFQVTNPGAVSFPQFTAGNAVITRTLAQTLSDIGGESALTFSTPLTRSVSPPNIIGIQAAGVGTGSGQSGYLTGSDWVLFNGKLSSNRTLTTTAPIRIDGLPSANLTADRTLSMAAASGNPDGTSPVDGYLRGTDFITFTNKVPQSRTIGVGPVGTPLSVTNLGQLTSNLTLSISKATASVDGYLDHNDFVSFQSQIPVIRQSSSAVAGVLTLADVSPPITRVIINQALTGNLTIQLPQASGYSFALGYPFIEIIDVVPGGAQGLFQVFVNRTAGVNNDTIDGATSITLSKATGYLRINSNATNRWLTTKYTVDSFKDPTDPTKQVLVNVSSLPGGSVRTVRPAPLFDSVTVVPVSGDISDLKYVYDVDQSGNLLRTSLPTSNGANVGSYVSLPLASAILTWSCDQSLTKQKASVTLVDPSTALVITDHRNGEDFELIVKQDGNGNRALTLPSNARTPANGLGLITLTSTASAVDKIRFTYDGLDFHVDTPVLNLTKSVAASCTVTGDTGAIAGGQLITQGVGGSATGTTKYVSFGTFTAGSSYTFCRLDVTMQKVLNPTFNLFFNIYTDNAGVPGTPVGNGVTIAASALTTNMASYILTNGINGNPVGGSILSGSLYHVVVNTDQATGTGSTTDFVQVSARNSQAGHSTHRSTNGSTWTALGGTVNGIYTIYHS